MRKKNGKTSTSRVLAWSHHINPFSARRNATAFATIKRNRPKTQIAGFYPLKSPFFFFLSGGTWSWRTFFSRVLMSSE